MEDKQAKIKAAREKLQAKYQGQQSTSSKVNRTKKVTRSSGPVNTKLKTIMKKVGAETIPDIAEVNFFTESGQVWRFKNPQVNGSIQNQTLFVTGTPEVQGLMDCFPQVMAQLGPQQLASLGAQAKLAGNAPQSVIKEEENEAGEQ